MSDVKAHGGAIDPARVCGAVWAKKSPAERRAIVALEEGTTMAGKKKGKKKGHSGKLHGAALKAHEKKAGHKGKGHKGKKGKHPKHHGRCVACGHSHKGPCLHIAGGQICPCDRPVHRKAA